MQRLTDRQTPNTITESLSAGMIGTWQWSTNSDHVWLDKSLIDMLGLQNNRIAVDDFINQIHADDRREVEQSVERVLSGEESNDVEFRMTTEYGIEKWFVARGQLDDDSKDQRLLGVLIDVTAKKRMQVERDLSQVHTHFMADSMPHLVWITGPDGIHEYFNQHWYEYTGTTPGETDEEHLKELLHRDDQERVMKTWKRSIKTGEPYDIEYRLYHGKSDSYRWVLGRARAFRDDSGKIEKWYGTSTDIDDHKRHVLLQTFLANASKQLATSLDYVKTLKKVTELCVPEVADWCAVDMYDAESDQLKQIAISHVDTKKVKLAKRYRELHPMTPEDDAGTAKVFRTGETAYYPVVDENVLKAGAVDEEARALVDKLQLRSAMIVPLTDRGEPIGTITFISSDSRRQFDDEDLAMAEKIATRASLAITNAKLYDASLKEIEARKQLEKELLVEKQNLESRVKERTAQLHTTNEGLREEIEKRQDVEEELIRSNKELQDFAYVASHDLQEPLRKIQSFGDILKTEYREQLADGADYLDRMLGAAARMSSLIQDLLAFSRVTNGERELNVVDLNEVLSGVIDDLSMHIKDLDANIEVSDLPSVVGDVTHMRQLFQNLLSNALKFHKPDQKPSIKVSAKETSKYVTLEVTDKGIGFDEKYADKIFSVFQRLHGRDEYQGTGIGLAVCRKIVEKYGGTIIARGEPGKGATFIIRLRKAVKE